MKENQITDTLIGQVVTKEGPFMTTSTYYRGWHPEYGKGVILTIGLTGQETVVRTKGIEAVGKIKVIKNENE